MISVIIPVYKVEKYLKKCVDSIINQTYKKLEIILVDDGSPDNCPVLCDEYAQIDNRIRVIHQKNAGLSAARNAGIKIAKGEYIGFVDSDDYIAPNMYEQLLQLIINADADLAICNVQMVDDSYQKIPFIYGVRKEILSREQVFGKLNNSEYDFYNTAWNKLYKRELFDKILFPVGKLHEDEFVVHEIFDKCHTIVTTDEKYYFYLQRNNSIMSSPISIKRLDGCEAQYNRFMFYGRNKELHQYMLNAARGIWAVYYNVVTNISQIEDKKSVKDVKKMIKSAFRIIPKHQFMWKDWLMYLCPDLAIKLRHMKKK